eukprot:CAMPEP_0184856060 /NCGR_PEP_ID=MMETSP0580-20130426/1215_1 /TAXON_ID=1118495 /ORGANISM="Dactyliosolen fragilissimus" /LENGTH=140 /DNA_ID=CAMNT_0027350831 /DNA_START=164 /DNA_END=586 /DNA_ORIENTATION=-
MENGGYGPPDNDDMEDDFDETTFLDDNGRRSRRGNRSRRHRHQGVNERSRRRWEHFKFHVPTCSICLGEYENGDDLTRLPCQHTYHTQCVDAWCSNHVRCPLCNANLDEESSSTSISTLNQNESSGSRRFPRFGRSDSIV